MVALGQEKIEGFASATEFDDELIDGLRFILERKSGLLSQEKMQFFAAGGGYRGRDFRAADWMLCGCAGGPFGSSGAPMPR
ncbi:MAG: hypothetical protein WBL92_09120 [Methanothrix sp.]